MKKKQEVFEFDWDGDKKCKMNCIHANECMYHKDYLGDDPFPSFTPRLNAFLSIGVAMAECYDYKNEEIK